MTLEQCNLLSRNAAGSETLKYMFLNQIVKGMIRMTHGADDHRPETIQILKDKFNLTREQSIFLAKKKTDEILHCVVLLENRGITFPQTQTIMCGVNVPDVSSDDIQAIGEMRGAWQFMLNTLDEQIPQKKLSVIDGSNTEKAIAVFLKEANKRNSLLLANRLLLSKGNGLLVIKERYMEQFKELNTVYTETGEANDITQFLYKNAIIGIEFPTTAASK